MMQWLLKAKEMNSMNDLFATSFDHWPAPQRLKQFAAFGPLTESLAWHPDRWLGLKDPELLGALWWEQGWSSCIVGTGISQLKSIKASFLEIKAFLKWMRDWAGRFCTVDSKSQPNENGCLTISLTINTLVEMLPFQWEFDRCPHLAAATIPKSKVTRLAWSEGKLGGSSHVITYCWHGWFLVWSPFAVDLVAVGIFPPGEKNVFLIGILVRKRLWRWTRHWFWTMTALKSRD